MNVTPEIHASYIAFREIRLNVVDYYTAIICSWEYKTQLTLTFEVIMITVCIEFQVGWNLIKACKFQAIISIIYKIWKRAHW
jgi:hypothetical protein